MVRNRSQTWNFFFKKIIFFRFFAIFRIFFLKFSIFFSITKLDYISSLLPQTACLGYLRGPKYNSRKLTKSAIFGFFFSFFNITLELFIVEEKFCLLKFRSHRAASFPIFVISLQYFSAELLRKNRSSLGWVINLYKDNSLKSITGKHK